MARSPSPPPLKAQVAEFTTYGAICFLSLPRPVYGRLYPFSAPPRQTTLPKFKRLLAPLKRLTGALFFFTFLERILCIIFTFLQRKKRGFYTSLFFYLILIIFNYKCYFSFSFCFLYEFSFSQP